MFIYRLHGENVLIFTIKNIGNFFEYFFMNFIFRLDGLLLAYKNPIILTPVAGILNDTSYIHIDVEADFYIFRPKVDAKLKGIFI